MRAATVVLALPVIVGMLACGSAAPRPIAYGAESCGYCRMEISDARFGATLVTAKGKRHAFDSIECLAGFALAEPTAPRALLVSDYNAPGALLRVDSADFHVLTGPAGSPMGKGLVATRRAARLPAGVAADTVVLDWRGVLAMVENEGKPRGERHAP